MCGPWLTFPGGAALFTEKAAAEHNLTHPIALAVTLAKAATFACAGAAAFVIVKCASPDRVYDLCLNVAGHIARLLAVPLRRKFLLRDPRLTLLQHMLCVATRHGGVAFRLRVEGGALLEEDFRRGVLLVTAHLGLTMAVQRVLFERNIPVCILGLPPRSDGLHWNCPAPAPVIRADARGLLRARPILDAGKALLAYPDIVDCDPEGQRFFHIRRNLFRFAAQTATPVLFFDAVLDPDGTIAVRFIRPARNMPRNRAEADRLAEAFCAFLRARTSWPWQLEPQAVRPGTREPENGQPSILHQ